MSRNCECLYEMTGKLAIRCRKCNDLLHGRPLKPTPGKDYTSKSGRLWRWCDTWKCWQRENHTYKIYPGDAGWFHVSSHQCWHDGHFEQFEEAEREALGSDGVSNDE